MAIYALHMQVIGRGKSRSVVAAAAYRSATTLRDERQGCVHDYSRKQWVEHSEILLPPDPPAWIIGIDRETLWNSVDAVEKRKDSQCARELWVNIPRELSHDQRIALVREFVTTNFTDHGMVADVSFHAPPSTDGGINYHAHIMLTMRPLTETGFGPKERHERIPSGEVRPDGKPIFIDSRESWNSLATLDRTRLAWEVCSNKALAEAGSAARVDRRSYFDRGMFDKIAEPLLGIALHARELRGTLRDRFSQWRYARFARGVEDKTRTAFDRLDAGGSLSGEVVRTAQRFHAWYDRQIARLGGERDAPRDVPNQSPGLER